MLPLKDKEYYPNIRRCLVSGFFMQIACLESEKRGAYSLLREGQDGRSENACHHSFGRSNTCDLLVQEVLLHPSTSLGHKPEWIVFHELALSSKLFIKTGHALSMDLPAFQLVAGKSKSPFAPTVMRPCRHTNQAGMAPGRCAERVLRSPKNLGEELCAQQAREAECTAPGWLMGPDGL